MAEASYSAPATAAGLTTEEEDDVWRRLFFDAASKDTELRLVDGNSIWVHSIVLRNSGSRVLAEMAHKSDDQSATNGDASTHESPTDAGWPRKPRQPPKQHPSREETRVTLVDDDVPLAEFEAFLRVLYLCQVDDGDEFVKDESEMSASTTLRNRAKWKSVIKWARRWGVEEVASRIESRLCEEICEDTLIADLDFAVETLWEEKEKDSHPSLVSSFSSSPSSSSSSDPNRTSSVIFRRHLSDFLVANPAFFLHHIQRFRRSHVEFILSLVPQADIPQAFAWILKWTQLHPAEAGDLFQLLEASGVEFNMEMVKKCVEEGLLPAAKVAPLRDWLRMKKKKKAFAAMNGKTEVAEAEEEEIGEEETLVYLTRSHNHPKFRHFPAQFSQLRCNLFHDDTTRNVQIVWQPSGPQPQQPQLHAQPSFLKTHSIILTHSGSACLSKMINGTTSNHAVNGGQLLRIPFHAPTEVSTTAWEIVMKLLYMGEMTLTTEQPGQNPSRLRPVMTPTTVETALSAVLPLGLSNVERRCKAFLFRGIADFAVSRANEHDGSSFYVLLRLALRHSVKGVGEKAVEVLNRKQLPQSEEEMKKISLDVLWFILRTTALLRYV